MASKKTGVTFKNCTIDLENGVIAETKKEDVTYHSVEKLLSILSKMESFDLSYSATGEETETIVEDCE